MGIVISWLVAFSVLILVGAILALPILIPPIRRLGQQHASVRLTQIVIFGLTSFLIATGAFTWTGAKLRYSMYHVNYASCVCGSGGCLGAGCFAPLASAIRQNEDAIVNEIWLRQMMPSFFRHSCYATDAQVCRLTDEVLSHSTGGAEPNHQTSWTDSLAGSVMYIFFVIPPLTTGTLVWRFTRRRVI